MADGFCRLVYRKIEGFTLIEVLLVTVILLIIAGVSAPNFSPVIQKLELKQTAGTLADMIRYSQSRSIVTNKMVRLEFSSSRDSYWLSDEEVSVENDADSKSEGQKSFVRFASRYGKTLHISNRVSVKTDSDAIDFWPDGRIEKKDVEFCNSRQCLLVTTKGFWGKVNVVESASP